MSPTSPPPPSSTGTRVLLVILGVLFAALWIGAHVAWAAMSLMGSLMANDSGAASPDQHMALITGLVGGQILAASAGVPAGLAFFWRDRRKGLLLAFVVLFVIGSLCQVGAFYAFFSAAASHA